MLQRHTGWQRTLVDQGERWIGSCVGNKPGLLHIGVWVFMGRNILIHFSIPNSKKEPSTVLKNERRDQLEWVNQWVNKQSHRVLFFYEFSYHPVYTHLEKGHWKGISTADVALPAQSWVGLSPAHSWCHSSLRKTKQWAKFWARLHFRLISYGSTEQALCGFNAEGCQVPSYSCFCLDWFHLVRFTQLHISIDIHLLFICHLSPYWTNLQQGRGQKHSKCH